MSFVGVCCVAPARPKPGLSRQIASQPAARQPGPGHLGPGHSRQAARQGRRQPGKAQPGTRKRREAARSQSHMTGKSLVMSLVIWASSSFCLTFSLHRLTVRESPLPWQCAGQSDNRANSGEPLRKCTLDLLTALRMCRASETVDREPSVRCSFLDAAEARFC